MSLVTLIERLLHRRHSGCFDARCRIDGERPRARQDVWLRGAGTISFGRQCQFGWKQSPSYSSSYAYLEARRPGSRIQIGENCVFSNDVALIAESEGIEPGIRIGDRAVVGSRFRCYDSDFHSLDARLRHVDKAASVAPVAIGNDVFIGENVMILKGTILGDRCVVGAGSVVTGHFPNDSILAGNPAKVIRSLHD